MKFRAEGRIPLTHFWLQAVLYINVIESACQYYRPNEWEMLWGGKIWKASVNKPEKHVGKLDNYSYDRNRFKKFIEALPPNPKESWRQMGHKYWLQIKLDYQQVLQGRLWWRLQNPWGLTSRGSTPRRELATGTMFSGSDVLVISFCTRRSPSRHHNLPANYIQRSTGA